MRFHNVFPPEMAGLAEPDYGYYGEPVENYGYFAENPYLSEAGYGVDPALSYYGEPDPALSYYGGVGPLGYYGEVDPLAYYGEAEPVGYFAEEFPVGYYGEELPMSGYGENFPMGYYGEAPYQVGYGHVPEMVGYGEPDMAYYGEPEFAEPDMGYGYGGYVRDIPTAFNPGCPLPTNLSGYDDVAGIDGYSSPATVNPTCDQMTPQPGSSPSMPDTFKPLW